MNVVRSAYAEVTRVLRKEMKVFGWAVGFQMATAYCAMSASLSAHSWRSQASIIRFRTASSCSVPESGGRVASNSRLSRILSTRATAAAPAGRPEPERKTEPQNLGTY